MRNRIVSFLARLCIIVLLINALGSFALAVDTPVEVGYKEIPLYKDWEYIGSGYLIDGVTFVPVRSFCETVLGTEFIVNWDQEDQSVTLDAVGLHILINQEDTYFTANDRCLYIPEGVYNINGTLLMPIRPLAKAFNAAIYWNSYSWSIDIETDDLEIIESGDQFYDDESLYWLSRVITAEAGYEPFLGQIAVGNVVLNRVNDTSGNFPNTVKGVVFQSGQFQVVSAGTIYNDPFDDAVVAAKLCMEGYKVVGESLFFLNPSISSNYWFRMTRTYVTTIQGHEFYA